MTALDDARAYIVQRFGATYTAWMALDDATATQTLVSSADYLNRLPWKGTATGVLDGNPTSLAWPRSGVVVDGVEIDSLTIPADVTKASYEMGVLILANPALVGQADTGSNIRSVGGGGAPTVEFFVPTSAALGNASRLPFLISQLVGKFLASPADFDASSGGSGNTCSGFRSDQQFSLVFPE